MALRWVPLYDDSNQPLLDDNGDPLLVEEDVTTLDGAHGGGSKKYDNRLWELYQEEVAVRFKPKPPPEPEPEPEVIEVADPKPAPTGGFFNAPMDFDLGPEFLVQKAIAEADARHAQYVINRRTISELLRKARR